MNPSHPLDPEELLQHAPWAHRLACSLVGESAAADLVQDAWVRALRRPPRGDRPLRPWLGTVLGNLARDRARGRSRRQAREERGSRSEAVPSAAELTERTESQRLLMEALLQLEPDLRQLVLLRFVEERSAAQIARDLGLSASTVKSRLERGLDELRGHLTERHGSREAWSLALLPLVRLAPRAGMVVLSTTLQLITMKLLSSPVALVALLFVLIGGYVAVGPLGLLESGPEREPVHFTMLVPELVDAVPAIGEAGPQARELVSVAPEAPAVAADSSRLRVRFLDSSGQPIAGVQVTVGPGEAAPVGLSLGDGVVELETHFRTDREAHTAKFQRAGFAADSRWVEFVYGEMEDVGDVVLRVGGDLQGLVVDGAERPLVGAWVDVQGEEIVVTKEGTSSIMSTEIGAAQTRTDENGRFELKGLLAGDVRVRASAEGELYSGESGLVEIRAGELTSGLVIVAPRVPDSRLIEGVVVDPDDAPVPACRVSAVYHSGTSRGKMGRRTDENGHFRFITPRDGVFDLIFKPRAESGVQGLEMPGLEPGTLGLRVVLKRSLAQDVRVVDTDGEPLGSYAIRVIPEGASGPSLALDDEPRPDGRMAVSLPSGRSSVFVLARGFFEGRLDGVVAVAGSAPLEIVLRRMPGVSGIVRTGGGTVAGAVVILQRVAADRVTFNGFPVRFDGRAVESTTTDELGAWRLDLREAGRFVVRIAKAGYAPLELGPFDVDPAIGLGQQDAELGAGGSLVVRVHGAAGALATSAIVAISRGDCFARTGRADEEGLVRFEHLMPGPWMATLWAEEIGETYSSTSESPSVPFESVPSNTEVWTGKTTELELWREGRAACRIAGSFALEGVDLEGWAASLSAASESSVGLRFVEAGVGSDGRFALETGRPGDYRIVLVEPGERKWRIEAAVELLPGENVWERQLKTARVELVAARDFTVALSVALDSGVTASRMVSLNAGEVAAFEGVPAGALSLIGHANGEDRSGAPFVRTLDLEAGGFERIELP